MRFVSKGNDLIWYQRVVIMRLELKSRLCEQSFARNRRHLVFGCHEIKVVIVPFETTQNIKLNHRYKSLKVFHQVGRNSEIKRGNVEDYLELIYHLKEVR